MVARVASNAFSLDISAETGLSALDFKAILTAPTTDRLFLQLRWVLMWLCGRIRLVTFTETTMTTQLATLEAEALKLSPEDRVLLADHVLASLRGQDEVEEAWSAEVDRRLAEVEAETVSLIPVEQAVRRARQAL